jgi:transcriptional regulator
MDGPLLQGTLDLLILTVLEDEPRHGWAIAGEIGARSADTLRVQQGSLYPALRRLEKAGLIRASWGRSENNRRARFYRLTPTGRARLREEAESWSRLSTGVTRVLEGG